MTASLYQSGSVIVSRGDCAMLLTVGAQSAPRNHRLKIEAAMLPWPLQLQVV